MPSPEATLADFTATLDYEDIPDDVRETVRRAFLDTVGVTLAGALDDTGASPFSTVGVDTHDVSAATLLGLKGDASPAERALCTGTASHALDYDDLSWAMDGHPSVTLVPGLLALADETGASGRDLVTAYTAGFEVECALAAPISPDHYEAGWHATATFGAFGAAAAAASLLDLTPAQAENALNIAASTPSGLKRNFGSMTKPLHAGLCSRSGVTAARLAETGFTADSSAISGDRGFWDLYGPTERKAFTFAPTEWTLADAGIHVKYYPCCYFTHTSIAATQALVDEHGIDPDDIELIQVRAPQGAADALHHPKPETGLEAKFSMEYTVASAAVRDRVGLKSFEDSTITDPHVVAVRDRVEFTVEDDFNYDSHEAIVTIKTTDGTYERHQKNPPGTHDNPLTDAELREKFDECAQQAVAPQAADALAVVFDTLDDVEDVSDAVVDASHP